MKGKTTQATGTKITENKVFDVMRPGKTAASATSRPVIVGHKPQVKDPMMAKHNDEERSLLDSTQKVTIHPASSTKEPDTPDHADAQHLLLDAPEPEQPVPVDKLPEDDTAKLESDPLSTPDDVDGPTIASVAVTGAVEKPQSQLPEQPDAFDEPPATGAPEKPPEANVTETPAEPPTPQTEKTDETVGVVFEDLAPRSRPELSEDVDPLPVLPDEPTPQTIIVAHHTPKASAGKVLLRLFLLLVFVAIVLDILLDAGFIVVESIPHTNFF